MLKVTNLDAVRRDDVAEAVVVVTEELREVVKKNEKNSKWSAVKPVHGLGKLGVAQERRQELELKIEMKNISKFLGSEMFTNI